MTSGPTGIPVDLVLRRLACPASATCFCAFDGTQYLVDASFSLPDHFTVYGALAFSGSPPRLIVRHQAQVFRHDPAVTFSPLLVEIFAGTGALALGPRHLGAKVIACVERNRLAATHLRANQHGDVLEADLCDPDTIRRLHSVVPRTSLHGHSRRPLPALQYSRGPERLT